MLSKTLVEEAVKMSREGASSRDLPMYLFVSQDEFTSWFNHGKAFVDEGYGRDTVAELKADGDLDDFDILCLSLYKGIMNARWAIKKEMHRLVSESENPNLCFKYLEAVFYTDFDPRYAKSDDDSTDEDESATTFVMEHFFDKNKKEMHYNPDDAKFAGESLDEKTDTEQESQQEE